MKNKAKRRVRPLLLIFLWVWAGCIFMVLDLFLNVTGLDEIRPRAQLYRAMRYAGHKMVGEPYLDGDFGPDTVSPEAMRFVTLAALDERDEEDGDEDEDVDLTEEPVITDEDDVDPAVDIEALHKLARMFGEHARESLLATVFDDEEEEEVRAHAARYLGLTGRGSLHALEPLIGSAELSAPIRSGAVMGLGEIDSGPAAERALSIATGPSPLLQGAGLLSLKRMNSRNAREVLAAAAGSSSRPVAARVVACRSLGRFPESKSVLEALLRVLEDREAPAEVRGAAAAALGALGRDEAVGALTEAGLDPSPEVARPARSARRRLTRNKAG